MKWFYLNAGAIVLLAFSLNSKAADMPEVGKKYNCLGCHSIEKKLVGPAWKDIANKYKADPGARANLIVKMMKGGKGAWGPMPMPASPKMTEQESAVLVDFVLGL